MTRSEPRAAQAAPQWDGKRFIFSEAQASWTGGKFVVRHEQITKSRSWRNRHANHTIIINLGGKTTAFEAHLDDGARSLQPPTRGYMSIIPAGRTFAGTFQGTSTHYAVWEMTPDHLQSIASGGNCPRSIGLCAALSHNDDVIFAALSQLATAVAHPTRDAGLLGEIISHSLGQYLLQRHAPGCRISSAIDRNTQALNPREIARVQEFVNSCLDTKLHLKELAELVGRSVNEFLIGFRRHFGMTPYQYVINERLKRARWELIFTSKPISTIAYDCGFASQSHMTAAFQKKHWMPPGTLRAHERPRHEVGS
jgi:AraC family transcriptional regulator